MPFYLFMPEGDVFA